MCFETVVQIGVVAIGFRRYLGLQAYFHDSSGDVNHVR